MRPLSHADEAAEKEAEKSASMEIQLNRGTVSRKVNWAHKHFEQTLPVGVVFNEDEMIDVIGLTKGKGFKGVTSRWHTNKLPRKTHKVCARSPVLIWSLASGPSCMGEGFHSKDDKVVKNNGSTPYDTTEKPITPMGDFPHYGEVRNDFLMICGCCMGPKKRMMTLRKSLLTHTKRVALEKIELKFIETSSKFAYRRFQTFSEKAAFLGPLNKDKIKEEEGSV